MKYAIPGVRVNVSYAFQIQNNLINSCLGHHALARGKTIEIFPCRQTVVTLTDHPQQCLIHPLEKPAIQFLQLFYGVALAGSTSRTLPLLTASRKRFRIKTDFRWSLFPGRRTGYLGINLKIMRGKLLRC